jgi:hypothetical protein
MGRDRIRGTRARVRRSLRVAALASVVLLISWAPPTTDGPLVPIDDDPFPPHAVDQRWSAADLSEYGTCYSISERMVTEWGMGDGADRQEPSAPICDGDRGDADPEPSW